MPFENIDIDQKELFKNANKRVKQKKRLVYHLVFFVAGAIVLAFVNLILNYADDFTPFNLPWYLSVCLLWSFFLIAHAINVLFVEKLMGRAWEEKNMNILVEKQISKLKKLQAEIEEKDLDELEKLIEENKENKN